MWNTRKPLLLAVVACSVVAAGAVSAGATPSSAAGDRRPAQTSGRHVDLEHAWDREGTVTGPDGLPVRTFQGQDGLTYEASPPLVEGGNDTVYFGEEFDGACAYGRLFDRGLRRIAEVARLIEQSGRRVEFTVAPNKSAVNKRDLAAVQLPHGECDAQGIAQQDRSLDRFGDDNYLPLRRKLAAAAARGVHEYWRVDTHWTSIAATQWAYDLAKALDPELARRQSYRPDTDTLPVDLWFLGLVGQIIETGPGRATTTRVKVSPEPGTDVLDPNNPSPVVGWTTGPKKRTWPGRTLLLGDSFTYRSMDPLMHLFKNGRFLWLGHTPQQVVLDGIQRSDTVVIEVVQRYVPGSLLALPSFKKALQKQLRTVRR